MVDSSPNSKFKILIVDDEPVIADTLLLIFQSQGYGTQAAYSAETAIEAAKQQPPDLAVIDVVLPQMNGIDCAILLRGICPTCKIILFSGQAATTDLLSAARQSGHAFEILAKPVHPREMLATASSLLAEAPAGESISPPD